MSNEFIEKWESIFRDDSSYRRNALEPVVNLLGGNVSKGLVRGLGGVLGVVVG